MDIINKIDSYAINSDKIAQIYCNSILTYKELKEKSDALACYIIDKFGDDKTPVLIYGHKQHEMLISFLACSKAGHAYIPIDVTFPLTRVKDIVESSGAKLLLNIEGIKYDSQKIEKLTLDDINNIILKYEAKVPDEKYKVKEDENYYILYTSGSTGKPKGVQITKKCINTFMNWFSEYCQLPEEDNVIMNQVSYSFDVSVISVYIGLSQGKTLYVIDKNMVSNFKELFENFKLSNIALWVTTPSFAEMCLIDENFNKELLPKMKKMIFAGEVLTKKLISNLYERFNEVEIINGYGPTEATVLVTAVKIEKEMLEEEGSLPIGYPMKGCELDIVNEEGKKVEVGERGELIIIGDSVSVGYYNNEEMTNKHFGIKEVDGIKKRVYKTGDLVCMDKKGLIYFSGRKDFQVKLNGFRIELEDIENNIRNLDIVNNAIVFPVYNNEKISHLTAFVTLKQRLEEKEFKIASNIKKELNKLIPSYMVPRVIKVKEQFPLNTNGKINRKLLMEELK